MIRLFGIVFGGAAVRKNVLHADPVGRRILSLGPAFCSVRTRLIREDHLRTTRRKNGYDKMLKILKNMNSVFRIMFTPKNISYDII